MRFFYFFIFVIPFLFSCSKKAGEAKFVLEVAGLEKGTTVENCADLVKTRLSKFLGNDAGEITTKIVNNQIFVSFDYNKGDSISPERINRLFPAGKSGLGFWETYSSIDLMPFWETANKKVRENFGDSALARMRELQPTTANNALSKEMAEDNARKRDSICKIYPIAAILYPRMDERGYLLPGLVIGYCSYKDTANLMTFLNHPNVKKFFPSKAVFAFSEKPLNKPSGTFELYCLKKRNGGPAISGDKVSSAIQGKDINGRPDIDLQFNEKGTTEWAQVTKELAEAGKESAGGSDLKAVAMVLENRVFCAPGVASSISGGRSEISGSFSIAECNEIISKILSPMNFSSRMVSFS